MKYRLEQLPFWAIWVNRHYLRMDKEGASWSRGEGWWKFCHYKKPIWPQHWLWIFPGKYENLDYKLVVIISCTCSPSIPKYYTFIANTFSDYTSCFSNSRQRPRNLRSAPKSTFCRVFFCVVTIDALSHFSLFLDPLNLWLAHYWQSHWDPISRPF